MSRRKADPKPQSKATAHLLESLRRKRETRRLAKRFLIVCEDGKSAPNYFEALKKDLSLEATSIQVVSSEGRTQPIQVVQRAIERMTEAASPNSGTEGFERVWCVVDGDYGDAVQVARVRAEEQGIQLAVSTMCFEYWVLLHFEENNIPTEDCDAIIKTIKKRKYIPNYDKGKFDFTTIVGNFRSARDRAEKLRRIGAQGRPEDCNPCSDLYLLIDDILLNDLPAARS